MALQMSITIFAALAAVALASPLPGHHAESYVQLTNIANAAISHGGYEGYEGYEGSHGSGHVAYHHEPIAHPKYAYKYGVEDAHTGDYKDAHEERDGDIVKGEYSLLQPDGTKRTVHYTADHHNGFNAVVSYSGHAIHPDQHPTLLHAAPIEAYHGHAYH